MTRTLDARFFSKNFKKKMADMEFDGSGAPPAAVAKATDLSNADFCTKQK